jgi:uncharacterized FlaG/YvyC family protein
MPRKNILREIVTKKLSAEISLIKNNLNFKLLASLKEVLMKIMSNDTLLQFRVDFLYYRE